MAMTLRLSEMSEALLERLAESAHTTKTAVVEEDLQQLAQRRAHRTRVRAAFDLVDQRDAELLELLSQ